MDMNAAAFHDDGDPFIIIRVFQWQKLKPVSGELDGVLPQYVKGASYDRLFVVDVAA